MRSFVKGRVGRSAVMKATCTPGRSWRRRPGDQPGSPATLSPSTFEYWAATSTIRKVWKVKRSHWPAQQLELCRSP